ncbi:hypothetical protein LTR36_002509 [Oleoguttula mirabilis]|uniref:Uncharacterized protein n=1 Tax=Oleoguttula mirabilis TaxID=1507867 RepID=A0AAV9JKZ4_9PEZI|nr:hypothetical protein LTR36_002509 [Oleoguttula mirabilis]
MSHLPWSEHFDSSKHNPFFQNRNHNQRLEIESILATFHTQLHMVWQTEDQAGFQDLCKRIKKAGEGLEVTPPQGEDLYSKTLAGMVDKGMKELREAREAAKK